MLKTSSSPSFFPFLFVLSLPGCWSTYLRSILALHYVAWLLCYIFKIELYSITVQKSVKKDITSGDRVGLRGRGFLGGLSLCGVAGDLEGAAGGFPAGRGGRTTLRSREPPWGLGAGLRGRTMLTGWVPLGAGPGLRGRTSLLVWGS